jgi:hypothetical protein
MIFFKKNMFLMLKYFLKSLKIFFLTARGVTLNNRACPTRYKLVFVQDFGGVNILKTKQNLLH